MKSSAKRFALGTVIAAVSGYLAGILTAPKSGKDTREDIKDAASKGLSEAEKQLKKLHTEFNQVIEEAKKRLDEAKGKGKEELESAIEFAKQGKEKVRVLLSALHEGDGADDKDLQKAIKDAQGAIDELKKYLTK
jgi:gas vesicle protein